MQRGGYFNASLSDSDISNRKFLGRLGTHGKWGKKLGFGVRSDEREVVDEIMRLEERQIGATEERAGVCRPLCRLVPIVVVILYSVWEFFEGKNKVLSWNIRGMSLAIKKVVLKE